MKSTILSLTVAALLFTACGTTEETFTFTVNNTPVTMPASMMQSLRAQVSPGSMSVISNKNLTDQDVSAALDYLLVYEVQRNVYCDNYSIIDATPYQGEALAGSLDPEAVISGYDYVWTVQAGVDLVRYRVVKVRHEGMKIIPLK
ncbi:MAG: hypothetical protein JW739_05920 [Opitutales bacterium]|nr:hypothetical protein [Opitutales bacterium]